MLSLHKFAETVSFSSAFEDQIWKPLRDIKYFFLQPLFRLSGDTLWILNRAAETWTTAPSVFQGSASRFTAVDRRSSLITGAIA
ncbi:MAG: hypothetical protein C4519_16705 [Desulfobacteraceae bacterium]|nr:MAG: hypothetical protein C4519_16705 [Desulfobacteraceae bacterium]